VVPAILPFFYWVSGLAAKLMELIGGQSSKAQHLEEVGSEE